MFEKESAILCQILFICFLADGLGVDVEVGAGVHHQLQGHALALPVPAVAVDDQMALCNATWEEQAILIFWELSIFLIKLLEPIKLVT